MYLEIYLENSKRGARLRSLWRAPKIYSAEQKKELKFSYITLSMVETLKLSISIIFAYFQSSSQSYARILFISFQKN
jgi:hypothetical protein